MAGQAEGRVPGSLAHVPMYRASMNPRSITQTGLVLLGVYFALAGPVMTLSSVVGTGFAMRDTGSAGTLGLPQVVAMTPVLLAVAAPGALVIASE